MLRLITIEGLSSALTATWRVLLLGEAIDTRLIGIGCLVTGLRPWKHGVVLNMLLVAIEEEELFGLHLCEDGYGL